MAFDEGVLYIYTDGSSRKVRNEKLKKKTGKFGGKGIVFVYYDEDLKQQSENKTNFCSYVNESSNRMELCACIDGLQLAEKSDLTPFSKIIVRTDSNYVLEHIYHAIWVRPKNKRTNRNGIPIDYVEDWKNLVKILQKISNKHFKKVYFEKVTAHSGEEFNEEADESAVKCAQSKTRKIGQIKLIRRKFLKSKPGNIDVKGMELYIHPITIKRYKTQHMNKYRYEIVSRDNPDLFKKTGETYYKDNLSGNYIYRVRFDHNPQTPFIEEIISVEEKDIIKKMMIEAGVDMSDFN